MKLPKMKVVEVRYWALMIKDEFSPRGEEWPERFSTEEEAQAKIQRFRDLQLTRS